MEEDVNKTIDFEARRAFIQEHLPASCLALHENGYELPRFPERFLIIERSAEGPVWAFGAATFGDAARQIDSSDTAGIEDVDVWDVDDRVRYRVLNGVVALHDGGKRIPVRSPARSAPPQDTTTPSESSPSLPPDPEQMNNERSEAAKKTLMMFSTDFGERIVGDQGGDDALLEQNLIDLLANVGHLCDREGFVLSDVVRRAAGQYHEETDAKGRQFAWME
jgi:hypothetical protein